MLAGTLALASAGGCSSLGGVAPGSSERALRHVRPLSSDAKATTPPADASTLQVAAEAVAVLSEDLLRLRLQDNPMANTMICPVGISLLLAMLYAQADPIEAGVAKALGAAPEAGQTSPTDRDTMWRLVQLSLNRFDVGSLRELEAFDPQKLPEKPLLHVANNLLVMDGRQSDVKQEYVEAVRTWYDAEVGTVSLGNATEALNAWASLHTGGQIKESGIQVHSDVRLILQNAVLFAARWAMPFESTNTLEAQPFHLPDDKQTSADLMEVTANLALVEESGWRAVRVPYTASDTPKADKGLAVDIVLPDQPVSPTTLGPGVWAQATDALSEIGDNPRDLTAVRLRLPRLDLTTGAADLVKQLGDIGVPLADVEHIGADLSVDQATQQAQMVMDEKGTVAAALTEASVEVEASIDPTYEAEFFADHPYVLRVVDTATQVTVFEAVVMDPSSTSAL